MKEFNTVKLSAVVPMWVYILSTSMAHFTSVSESFSVKDKRFLFMPAKFEVRVDFKQTIPEYTYLSHAPSCVCLRI